MSLYGQETSDEAVGDDTLISETVQQKQSTTIISSGNVVVSNQPTVVYPVSHIKTQAQLNIKARASSPSVITSTAKVTTISATNNKLGKDKSIATRIVSQKLIQNQQQQHQQQQQQQQLATTNPPSISQSKIIINNAVNPLVQSTPITAGKVQVAYEPVQVGNNQQPATIIQSVQQVQTIPTGATVKTVPSSNVHRIQPNSKVQSGHMSKVKTITTGTSQQQQQQQQQQQTAANVVQKNVVSRIQVPKSQMTTAQVHQVTPITLNQVIEAVNNAPRLAQSATMSGQKPSQANNQKPNQSTENLQSNKNQLLTPIQSGQVQKVAGSSTHKAQNITRQQPQQHQQHQQKQVNNVRKTSISGLQKVQVQNHQTVSSAQVAIPVSANQNRNPSIATNIVRSDNSNSNNNPTQVNMTKSQHAATVTVVNKAQGVVQQMISQPQQQQQQIIHKQLPTNVPQRIQANINIQPKMNIVQQTLTNLPVNQKGSAIINTKIQQSQQQMVLRLEPGKNQIQGNMKMVTQKQMNTVKNSSTVTQRNPNMQPVKIIQQPTNPPTGQIYPNQGVVQKPVGCMKTITPQKSQQKNQSKPPGIKTSLNTNMNALKTIGGASATVITQKSGVKTTLPHHQQSTSNVVVQKTQSIKIQAGNYGQKQIYVAQFPSQQQQQQQQLHQQQQQQVRAQQIKAMLSVQPMPEIVKEVEPKVEPQARTMTRADEGNEENVEEESKRTQQPTVKRMPLPYECLQFVLQDHNYGAPPPRTPPPTSPILKQQQPQPQPQPQPQQQQQQQQQSANSGPVPQLPHQTFIYNQGVSVNLNTADDVQSTISSDEGREVEPEGEETETAPEGEGDEEDSVTRCICDFEHDDGYMICCDRCLVWQHVDCMGIDRSNIPDEYLCEVCKPRRVDRQRARTLQLRKREELLNSDTSSDTSSTSSADTNPPPPVVQPQKKRTNVTNQSRRKAETAQSRRPNNNNESNSNINTNSAASIATINSTSSTTTVDNTNVTSLSTAHPTANTNNSNNNNNNAARRGTGRRDQSTRQQTSGMQSKQKKEPVKRGPGKRRGKRRRSSIEGDDENQDAWGISNMAPLRQWIERYEEAVTNHYSPELRARLSSIKVNGTHSDLKQSNIVMSAAASGKCRVSVHSNSFKYLMATMYLPPNTPVVELRGKYMLSTQHRPVHHGPGRQHAQRPGPFVFFYRLPREGTEVCVDTRTYGNDARFVRRSCNPNAEIKHCLEKGTLHLYIVTITAIEKNTEITIRHEQHNLISPNSSSTNPMLPLACACGNPRTCQITSLPVGNVGASRRSSSASADTNSDGREKRRRGRKTLTSEEVQPSPSATVSSQPQNPTTTVSTTTMEVSATPGATTPKRSSEMRDKSKEEVPQVAQLPPSLIEAPTAQLPETSQAASSDAPAPQASRNDKRKMTREERKMEAIMKAFARMEKAEQRKQEVQARNAQRKESGGAHSEDESVQGALLSHSSKNQKHLDRPPRRKRRKGRARTTSTSQSTSHSRRTRLNSADSELSSADDDHLRILQSSSPSRRQPPSASQLYSPGKSDNLLEDSSNNPNSVIPTAAGLLLALANSNAPDTGRVMSPSLHQPAPSKSPTCDSGSCSSSQSSNQSTPLSSACLLVEAAVGPLAPDFKFPKTKKAMMNEWLRESPDLTQIPPRNAPLMSPTTVPPSKESPKETLTDYLNQVNFTNKGLATLVQAANSVSGICVSPPQRKSSVVCSNTAQNAQCPVSTGSAKKRWLRQAISEECDSPNSRPESPPNEHVAAPPKKRRIARESLSSDNCTPPTTPTPSNAADAQGLPEQNAPSTENFQERVPNLSSSSQSPTTVERHYSDCMIKDEENSDKKIEFYDNCKTEKIVSPVKIESEETIDTKLNVDSPNVVKMEDDATMKLEVKAEVSQEETVKNELIETTDSNPGDIEFKVNIKTEIKNKSEESSSDLNFKNNANSMTVCSSDKDINKTLDPTDTETRLEFDSNSMSEPGVFDPKKTTDEQTSSEVSRDDLKVEEAISLDEFDVEAQMKKITGDDGNDYKEKIETSSERDKNFDGIEGLMESSKEDSETSDKENEEVEIKTEKLREKEVGEKEKSKEPEKVEERAFKEFETVASLEALKEKKDETKKEKPECSEESMFDSISNLDCESVTESNTIFQSIPPLSERIRKKTTEPKKQLDFEAAIIESTLDIDSVELSNDELKTELSSALRQLLEAKIDQDPPLINEFAPVEKDPPRSPPLEHINESSLPAEMPLSEDNSGEQKDESPPVLAPIPDTPAVVPPLPPTLPIQAPPPEVRRLKDPRTAVPHERPPPETPPPVKRKLSISEYRKRKQQSSGTPLEPEPIAEASSSDKSPARGRSDSASSGTSSLSSDEDNAKTTTETSTVVPNLSILAAAEGEERKGGEEGTIGWSAAPTLVERQRENLTERLKREFGLFLSDDEEERARKHGLSAEAILKARKASSPTQIPLPGVPVTYPLPQLPPQPYIPPPGSAPIHFAQLPAKVVPGQPFSNFSVPNLPPPPPPTYAPMLVTPPPCPNTTNLSPAPINTTTATTTTTTTPSQFLVPQAPPGSNPYPPQFIPTTNALATTTTTMTPRFPAPTSTAPNSSTPTSSQKPYYHTHPPPRS